MSSVLVTGASGFLGRHLVAALRTRGHDVVALEHDLIVEGNVEYGGSEGHLIRVRGDVLDGEFLKRIIARYNVDTVFHLAAQSDVVVGRTLCRETEQVNLQGTINVLGCCEFMGVKKVVVASSDKVYGECEHANEEHPLIEVGVRLCPYSWSKARADEIATRWKTSGNTKVAVVRCGNLYGPGDTHWNRLIPGALRQMFLNKPFVFRTDGESTRDWLYVGDAVEAYVTLGFTGFTGPFNFSGGLAVKCNDIVRNLSELSGLPYQCIFGTATDELKHQSLDCTKAKTLLGWEPRTGLDRGLMLTVEWYRRYFGRVNK